MRRSVIDLGSCTFHALVADVDGYGIRREVFERSIAVRIGEHADSPGGIPDTIVRRGLAAVDELVERARSRAAELRVVATGVLRDSEPGRRFVAEANARTGATIDLLPGREEARLTWVGVSAELASSHGRLAILDIGGGSLEIAVGEANVDHAYSVPVGVLRLRSQPSPAVREAVTRLARPALASLDTRTIDTVAVSSGTARALLAIARTLGLCSPRQRYVSARTFVELARKLPVLPSSALVALGVPSTRLDTIGAGAVAYATLLDLLGRPVVYVARSALREGVLIDIERQRRPERSATQVLAIG